MVALIIIKEQILVYKRFKFVLQFDKMHSNINQFRSISYFFKQVGYFPDIAFTP